jgi:uncharacterized protein YbjT (DUF2867 family)
MTVLVTGATGNVGAAVVGELRARGAAVRAFARDAGRASERLGQDVELAIGDFDDPASVAAAVEGTERVFLSSADGPRKVEHERTVTDACAAAGVELIVKASTLAADTTSPLAPLAWNARSEEHLRRSGVPAVILASGSYMTNLLAGADEIRQGRLIAPAGDGRIAMVDPRDIGAVAAVVLTTDGHEGCSYRLTGPRAVSYAEVARALAEATGVPVAYLDVPEEAAREALVAAGLPGWLVEHLVGVFRLIRADALAQTTGDVLALAGRDPRDIAEFARDHAQAFGAVGAGAR